MHLDGEYIIKVKFTDMGVPTGPYTGELIEHICLEQAYACSKLNNKDIPEKRAGFSVEVISKHSDLSKNRDDYKS